MRDIFDIKGRVVAVTGATGVLAGAGARYLARCGAKVAFIGRSVEKLGAAQKFCDDNSLEGIAVQCDVLDADAVAVAKNRILEKWGRIDVLVNGAGGNRKGAIIAPNQTLYDLDIPAWEDVLKLNLEGTLLPIKIFGGELEKSESGAIVNFSSMTSQQAVSRVLGYSNAKAGVDNLTRWLAVEFAKRGTRVRVNALAPGFFVSEQNRELLLNPDSTSTQRGRDIIAKTPMGRFGEADDIFGALRFLCSDASKFITGTVIAVDGGFSCFSGV